MATPTVSKAGISQPEIFSPIGLARTILMPIKYIQILKSLFAYIFRPNFQIEVA